MDSRSGDDAEGLGGAGDDGSASPRINGEGISGGGTTRAFLDNMRATLLDTLYDIRNGALITPRLICADQHPSCIHAWNRPDDEYDAALDYLYDNLDDMIALHTRDPVPLLLVLSNLTVRENGQDVAREVIARWHPREEILFHYDTVQRNIELQPPSHFARFALTDLVHETVHLVKWNGNRVLDDSVLPAFTAPRGGARMAQFLGAILSYHAHYRGFITNRIGSYGRPMNNWDCYMFSSDSWDDYDNNLSHRVRVDYLTAAIHEVHFEPHSHSSPVYASLRLEENLNPNNSVDIPCNQAGCQNGLFSIAPSGRSSYYIPADIMRRLLGTRALLSDVSLRVTLTCTAPTVSCTPSTWIARAKVRTYMRALGGSFPSYACGF